MSSYAILGTTGQVGGSILKVLLQSPDKIIHAYCRSRQKLIDQNPGIDKNPNVRIFEGSMNDRDLLTQCVEGTRAVFITIAVTGSHPGTTIAQDTAKQVIPALRDLQGKKAPRRLPKLIVLSSASTEHRLMSQVSPFLRNTLYRAFSDIYDDLKVAEKLYRSEDAWLTAVFIKPGALSHDTQKGHVISMERAESPISFLDLAAGMVDVADEEGDRFDRRGVAINATSNDVAFPWGSSLEIVKGLIIYFLPWTYRIIG